MTYVKKYECCKPVLWQHEDGWDIYPSTECHWSNGHFVPAWFDGFILEDLASKAVAYQQLRDLHVVGVCLAH